MKTLTHFVKPALWLCALIIIILFFINISGESKKNEIMNEKRQQGLSVNTLPLGTQEAWDAYIDRRIAVTLKREGNSIRVSDNLRAILGEITYISINSPYMISCHDGGADIVFGGYASTTDGITESPSASIYGTLVEADPSSERPPALEVNEHSKAAIKLRENLCQKISIQVEKLFQKDYDHDQNNL